LRVSAGCHSKKKKALPITFCLCPLRFAAFDLQPNASVTQRVGGAEETKEGEEMRERQRVWAAGRSEQREGTAQSARSIRSGPLHRTALLRAAALPLDSPRLDWSTRVQRDERARSHHVRAPFDADESSCRCPLPAALRCAAPSRPLRPTPPFPSTASPCTRLTSSLSSTLHALLSFPLLTPPRE